MTIAHLDQLATGTAALGPHRWERIGTAIGVHGGIVVWSPDVQPMKLVHPSSWMYIPASQLMIFTMVIGVNSSTLQGYLPRLYPRKQIPTVEKTHLILRSSTVTRFSHIFSSLRSRSSSESDATVEEEKLGCGQLRVMLMSGDEGWDNKEPKE